MNGNGKEPVFRVIGIRQNDERVIISSHSTEEVAEKVVRLIRGGDFKEVRIEEKIPVTPKC